MIHNISILNFLKKDIKNIIDIRSIQNYNHNHIEGARHIEKDLLLKNPKKYLNKDEVYYIYSQKGIRSIPVCRKLLLLGYKVINIEGGYEEWILKK